MVETLGLIVFIREKTLSNTNLLASKHIKREKASLPVDVRRSKKSLRKLTRPSFLVSKVVISNYMYATGGVRKRDNSTPLSELN